MIEADAGSTRFDVHRLPGIALVVRDDGRIVDANAVAEHALELLPTGPVERFFPAVEALAKASEAGERSGDRIDWDLSDGRARILEIASSRIGASESLVLLRDITSDRTRQAHLATLGRTAARTANSGSLEHLLEAMASEIHLSDGIAGVQIIAAPPGDDELRIMGSAGFEPEEDFFLHMMQCHERGASLATLRAMRTRASVVEPDRKRRMLASDAWEPLHRYIADLSWTDFVSTPLIGRGEVRGVLNAYLRPSSGVDTAMLTFLEAVAEQAALGVDYHSLIAQERRAGRLDERQRLGRELHDSVLQRLFAIGMHAKALESTAFADRAAHAQSTAIELQELTQAAQRDLRRMIGAMQPSTMTDLGLAEALRRLPRAYSAPPIIELRLPVDAVLDALPAALADDLYAIVSEAVHNAFKHARATVIIATITVDPGGRGVALSVADDGVGDVRERTDGYGLRSMRDRSARWSGDLQVASASGRGTDVRVRLAEENESTPRRSPDGVRIDA